MVPLRTAVLQAHGELVTGSKFAEATEADAGLTIWIDLRRGRWRERMSLPRGTQIHWADVRTVDIKELSSLSYPIRYRLTYGDGWYLNPEGKRTYFSLQKHLSGIDLDRQCTTVTLRAAVLLAVMGGVGLRCVGWLMAALFNCEVSKSALERWVQQCATELPDAAEMAQRLNSEKPITEANFDEIFSKGQRPKRCTFVLRDEHGRIFATQQVEERSEASVVAFLRMVRSWGIVPKVFYVDGCEAYRQAIPKVFPEAVIQYDYFHVIQNIWRKLWKSVVARRRTLKERGESAGSEAYSKRLLALASRIWDHRWLLFKRDENLSEEERSNLHQLVEADDHLKTVRGFTKAVWQLFDESKSPLMAHYALMQLKGRSEVKSGSVFKKVTTFLESRFEDMISFIRHPGVRRNSLAETGIRCLRRIEQGHDGFRGAASLDRYIRIYQAIKYCGWTVYQPGWELALPPVPTALGPPPITVTPAL
jgi:transposase-like protein